VTIIRYPAFCSLARLGRKEEDAEEGGISENGRTWDGDINDGRVAKHVGVARAQQHSSSDSFARANAGKPDAW